MNLKSFACFGKISFVFTTTIIIVHTQSGSDRKILADRALANVEEQVEAIAEAVGHLERLERLEASWEQVGSVWPSAWSAWKRRTRNECEVGRPS